MSPAARFDHEKLDVYQLQLHFIEWLAKLFEDLHTTKPLRLADTLDQLDRASLSVLLNIAEGNGRRGSAQRARFFDDARGSGTECAACLDALRAKGAVTDTRIAEGKVMLLRVVSMLSKLVERFGVDVGASSRTRTRTNTKTRAD